MSMGEAGSSMEWTPPHFFLRFLGRHCQRRVQRGEVKVAVGDPVRWVCPLVRRQEHEKMFHRRRRRHRHHHHHHRQGEVNFLAVGQDPALKREVLGVSWSTCLEEEG